jgi:hypothetical protein
VADELPQIEAPYRAVSRCQGRLISFHATLAQLPTLFGMAEQGFDPGPAICQASKGFPVAFRQTAGIEAGLLKAKLVTPEIR